MSQKGRDYNKMRLHQRNVTINQRKKRKRRRNKRNPFKRSQKITTNGCSFNNQQLTFQRAIPNHYPFNFGQPMPMPLQPYQPMSQPPSNVNRSVFVNNQSSQPQIPFQLNSNAVTNHPLLQQQIDYYIEHRIAGLLQQQQQQTQNQQSIEGMDVDNDQKVDDPQSFTFTIKIDGGNK